MDDSDLWTYQARPDPDSDHPRGAVDGDTLDLELDLGLSTRQASRVRLSGADTAETYGVARDTDEYAAGTEQARFVVEWLATAVEEGGRWPLLVTTRKDTTGKYGRLVATIQRRCDERTLTVDLIDEYPTVAN